MFGWRRRSEGFEWQEYVRTTILVRRADRQRKVDDVRMAALAKARDTKDRGVAASRAAAKSVSQSITELIKDAAVVGWTAVSAFATACWRATASALATLKSLLAEHMPAIPKINWPGLPNAAGGMKRAARMMPDVGFRFPINSRVIGGGAAAIALVVVGGPMLSPTRGTATSSLIPTISAPKVSAGAKDPSGLTGRATAVSGDLLRINRQLIKLTGIEPPEAKQPCLKSNGRRWNCGASARAALEKIVRGKTVVCTGSGQDSERRTLAACRIDDADIAETLVSGGHVFAVSGFFASYTSAEAQARTAQVGIWQGESLRPKEWRDQVWEDAKRSAPEGCPIKGFSRASDRVYALPWSHDYHGAKVRTVKGDRWFCSEDEARAAGFKLSSSL
jgi:endonuclease YncB( thermonuclease family)